MMDTELRASASNENVTTNLEEDQGVQDEAEERRDEHLLIIFSRQPQTSSDFHLRRDNPDCNSQGSQSAVQFSGKIGNVHYSCHWISF